MGAGVGDLRGWFQTRHGYNVILDSAFSKQVYFSHNIAFLEDFQDGQMENTLFSLLASCFHWPESYCPRRIASYYVLAHPVLQVEWSHHIFFALIFSYLSSYNQGRYILKCWRILTPMYGGNILDHHNQQVAVIT